MKKSIGLFSSVIALILTFIFAEVFSLYHFGSVPTFLTVLYLISLFSVFDYILLSIVFIIKKIISKQKISGKEILGRILLFVSLILILGFIIVIDIDCLNWYAYSSPFYLNVIVRSVQFLLPSILFIIIGIVLIRKKKQ